MNARELVEKYGEDLIGREVITPAMCNYPGGRATVIGVHPDPEAPDIVFDVLHPSEGIMGILENENIRLIGE